MCAPRYQVCRVALGSQGVAWDIEDTWEDFGKVQFTCVGRWWDESCAIAECRELNANNERDSK